MAKEIIEDFLERESPYLLCLYCSKPLKGFESKAEVLKCPHCQVSYPVVNKVPILINENRSIFTFADFTSQRNLFFDITPAGKLRAFIAKNGPTVGGSNLGRRNYKFLSGLLKSDRRARVLILGGSIVGEGMDKFLQEPHFELIESDVSFGPRTQVVFDAHQIPYQDESVDCVVVQAVLEHLIDPQLCVREIHRILKPGGVVYAETPFMQQVHGGPYDFTRFTRSGHRKLFESFEQVKAGPTAGSGTAFAWAYQYLLLSLFGYGKTMRYAVKFFARITGFWMKYIDYITRLNPRDVDGASGFFFIGRKSTKTVSDRQLIDYYFTKE